MRKQRKKTAAQKALYSTVNWFLYSNRPWPFGKSERHLVVRAVLENRNPLEPTPNIDRPTLRNKRGLFLRDRNAR
jgi:hypothetical protein